MGTPADAQMLLLERGQELEAIDDALADARAGNGVGLLLRGPPGIGKSALLAAARALAAERGLRVLAACGGVFEREYPFGVARQLLERVAADFDLRATMFSGGGQAAAPVLAGDPVGISAPDAGFAAVYGLHCAFANLAADGPLVLSVDDGQWADGPSMRVLDFLIRRLDDLPVAVVMAVRSGEALEHEPHGALAELEAARLVRVLEPRPLSASAAVTLTERAFGDSADPLFAAACHARTGGNPFFLSELLRELAEEGVEPTAAAARRGGTAPRGVSRVVLARLARLGGDAVALARAVTVLGDETRLVDAAKLAGLSRELAAAAAERLITGGLFADREGLSFEHSLIRDAVETDIPSEVLVERHARAADVLEAHGRDPEAIATHSLMSPPSGNVVTVERLRAAARIAVARSAPDEAVTLLTRALAEPPAAELLGSVLFELGAAEAGAQRPESLGHLIAARDRAAPGAERALVALVLARLLMFAGRSSDVNETVALGQAGLGESERELWLGLEAIALSADSMHAGSRRLTPEAVERFSRLDGATPGERAVLASVAVELTRAAAPLDLRLELVDRALMGGGLQLIRSVDFLTTMSLSMVLQWSGRLARAVELANVVIEQARIAGSSLVFTEGLAFRATTRWRAGALDEAEADARQALETEGLTASRSPFATSALVRTLCDRGEFSLARDVASAVVPSPGREDLVFEEVSLVGLARCELALGRNEDALDRLMRAGKIADAAGALNPAVSEWRVLACSALVGLGRHEAARGVLAPALESARRSGGPGELGSTLHAAALAEQPVNIELLREALSVLEPSELILERARVMVALGAALRRAGSRREARGPLAKGMELASRCGATLLTEQAMSELHAAGGRPRRIERSGADALTPSERRVARLAAEGRLNREIAQQLFVSSRTVEAHLRGAYMKLGISSRQQLSAALSGSES